MIFHNEMDDIAGLPLVNPDKLSFDYASLIYYLQSLGLIVKSRQKPSHSYTYQIPKIIEEAEGPLIDFLNWPDFCISIGTPTTALINFWEKGLPCIHLTYYELTETAKGTLPDDVMVINLTDFESIKYPSYLLLEIGIWLLKIEWHVFEITVIRSNLIDKNLARRI